MAEVSEEHGPLEANGQSEAGGKIKKSYFVRKATSISDIKMYGYESELHKFIIEKVITVSPAMYKIFSEHLYYPYHFIRENNGLAYDLADDTWHCALIRPADRVTGEGILVTDEGFEYARYSGYVSDCSRLDLSGAELIEYEKQHRTEEIDDIKGLMEYHTDSHDPDPIEIQKLICGIGEIFDSSPKNDELPDQFYLYSNTTNGFAGFCGYPAHTVDSSGEQLHVGDVVAESARSTDIQIVWQDRGHTIPSQDHIESHNLKKVYSWYGTNGIAAARSLNFDVLSCRSDYKTMKRIIQQTVRQIQQKDIPPRDR